MTADYQTTYDVFISYSSHDKQLAHAACVVLEAHRIRCWIAPRDVLPGTEWGASIIDAIDRCRVMVLIFSARSNASSHVRREVERAIAKGRTVLPFRMEDIRPAGAMEYSLSNTHWLDAFTPPVEAHLQPLAASVQMLLLPERQAKLACAGDIQNHLQPASKSLKFIAYAALIPCLAGGVIACFVLSRIRENPRNQQLEQKQTLIPIEQTLTRCEEIALGLILVDAQGATRGAWGYPLHQQITYRGFTEAEATMALAALISEGFVEFVEIEEQEPIDGKHSKLPAYRITAQGLLFARAYDSLRSFKACYHYIIRLHGVREENETFLDQLKIPTYIERETRFIEDADPSKYSTIAVWSYEKIDRLAVIDLGIKNLRSIVSFSED
ncbi:MAG TPA: toll/interleukin-1 receptor domain-containing protein [Planctomycetaceae bacterium]|nr:toll/interleukin-1 receptor domain-containing protein [Planctomycetaceae bacterium]